MNKPDFAQLVRETGEKATKARIEILSALSNEEYPIAIKKLALKVKAPDQATLYRNLEGFVRNGLVREIRVEKGLSRYEIAIGRKHHHHITCTSCGFMEDIPGCRTHEEKHVRSAAKKFAKITGHSLEFFGLCKACVI